MSLSSTLHLVRKGALEPSESASQEPLEAGDLTDVELGLIWKALVGEDWDETLLDDLEMEENDLEQSVLTLPPEFVNLLAESDPSELAVVADTLMEEEEFETWSAHTLIDLLQDLQAFAASAVRTEKSVLLVIE